MTKKTLDSFLVQAYQCPYTQQLFGADKKIEFEKHLRAQEKYAREQQKRKDAVQARLNTWANLRQKATGIADIPTLLDALPESLLAFYQRTAGIKASNSTGWKLTFQNEPVLNLYSITHQSPVGQPTNWGFDNPHMPKSLIGLGVKINESLNSCFQESSRESGFTGYNNELVLYADDWPFVARLALVESLDNKNKYWMAKGPDLDRYVSDMDRYSQTFLGMPYDELAAMYKTLGLTPDVVCDMMAKKEEDKQHGEPALPEGVADEVPGF